MTTDRHKIKPKAVRMPDGLLAWYKDFAETEGTSVNAALVAALQEFQARHSDTASAGTAN